MYLFDVHATTIDIYKNLNGRIQKATRYETWNDFKYQIIGLGEDAVLFFDESKFEYMIYQIEITQEWVFTRTDFKHVVTTKIQEIQQQTWCDRDQVRYHIAHPQVNKKDVDSVIWADWTIRFDICCMIADVELLDLLQNTRLRRYPRRYFIFSHPLIFWKEKAAVLVVEQDRTLLIKTQHGWYDQIHSLNWGDDLLIQAYEQAGIDPEVTTKKDFSAYTLWEKLIVDVHETYVQLLMDRLQQYELWWVDIFVVSRLVDQKYFINKVSELYTTIYRGRVIPFAWSDRTSFDRTWDRKELPILLGAQKLF